MSVLITGGAGFIGANVAHALLAAGEEVRIFDSLARPGVERNVRWLQDHHHRRGLEVIVDDVRDGEALRHAMGGVDHVLHLAAQVAVTTSIERPGHDFDVNAGGTLHVLEAARAQRRPPSVLFTSTNKVYGALSDVPFERTGARYRPVPADLATHGISESRPLSFHSPYGCSKGAADQYVLDYAKTFDLRAVVFRMSCIYGPRQLGTEDQGWLAHFVLKALRDEPITIYGDGYQVRDVLFVDDLVRALHHARADIERLSGLAFNIGGGPTSTLSLHELIREIERRTRRPVRLEHAGWRRADQRWYVSDTRAFTGATGWRPTVSVSDGLAHLFEWLGRAPESRAPAPSTAGALS